MRKPKQKIILPPELPPEISEDEIEVSDEDLDFVKHNKDYAGFVSRLDTKTITKHVTRVADVEEDKLEALYEKRLLRKKQQQQEKEESGILQVDPVDALPVKSLDGQLYYRTTRNPKTAKNKDEADGDDKDVDADQGIIKLTKAEKREKLKKLKKNAKKKEKESVKDEVSQAPQAAVLAEVKEDLTAEEKIESKKLKLAELGMELLADPESNIKSLKEMLEISRDSNEAIVKLSLLSLLAVFKNIIPGYRIRLPTEKELEMKVSREVKKMRFYESTLLSSYKAYLQKLVALEKKLPFHQVAVRCICTLLDAAPHFNYRESLLDAVVNNISSPDNIVRKLCCSTIKSLFTNEGKHGGEITVEAVRLIAALVKANDCQLHPDSVEVFLSLSFDEDLGKPDKTEDDNKGKGKGKYGRKRKNVEENGKVQGNDRKKSKQELMKKLKEEVVADYKSAGYIPDATERKRMQSDTLSAVFETYFRILKHTLQSTSARPEGVDTITGGSFGTHPLLAPCLQGLGQFSHLIDLDFMGDLMNHLKKLAGAKGNSDNSVEKCSNHLSVTERLNCCIVAFKVMRNNFDALNVDLQDFFLQLYNIILEYRPGRDQGEVLADALKIMLCDGRQHDMQKAAAFVKRLATLSLCFGTAESMAALVTIKHLLQKNVKCRNLLENDAGGGSVSGFIAKYQPFASDPNLSGALASVLWELSLLSKHYHPSVSTMASNISCMNTSHNQVYLAIATPHQAFTELSLDRDLFSEGSEITKSSGKKKRASKVPYSVCKENALGTTNIVDEDEVRRKLSKHFTLVRNIKENERVRRELDCTKLSLSFYEEYKKQKKTPNKKQSSKTKKNVRRLPNML